jgi:hypothetical protein
MCCTTSQLKAYRRLIHHRWKDLRTLLNVSFFVFPSEFDDELAVFDEILAKIDERIPKNMEFSGSLTVKNAIKYPPTDRR